MPFSRHLDGGFIDALNKLYEQGGWWKALVNSKRVFLALDNNRIRAYANGGGLARIAWRGGKVVVEVHEEYLTLPSRRPNVRLMPDGECSRPVITTFRGYHDSLDRIIRRIRTFKGDELRGENLIGCNLTEVLDMEVVLEGPDNADDLVPSGEEAVARKQDNRVDLVALCGNPQRLCFVEAKLFENGDLWTRPTPRVCDQLNRYHMTIKKKQNEIKAAYGEALKYYGKLEGEFFKRRKDLAGMQPWEVDTVPHLLIFSFGQEDVKAVRDASFLDCIINGAKIQGFCRRHIQSVGGAGNAQACHLSGDVRHRRQ